jgi:hypothetical protein
MGTRKWLGALCAFLAGSGIAVSASALTVTQTTNGSDLLNAFVPNQGTFGSVSATFAQGDGAQAGTYTGFNLPPVTIGNGVVLSTGQVVRTPQPWKGTESANFFGGSTAQIDAYAPGNIQNFFSGNDAAVLQINFNLASDSAVAFDIIFGTVEHPVFTSSFTDGFLVFLDGEQITFDANGNPVQVGSSFAASLRSDDQNTIFTAFGSDPQNDNDNHALLDRLVTTSGNLAAGDHTISFQIFDTNDGQLDSAVFLSNFRTAVNAGDEPVTQPPPVVNDVPEPVTLALLGLGAGLLALRRRESA